MNPVTRPVELRSPPRGLVAAPREINRARCFDADGEEYTVIIWRLYPDLATTTYTLDDGSKVNYVSECEFEIAATGKFISRCEESPID